MRRFLWGLVVLLAVAGCAAKQQPNADPETIAAVSYRDPGGPALTLYTMINNRTGQGAHTSLMINASERVVFDPAGSFYADIVPERDDVLFGFSPRIERAYRTAHARSTHHVVIQTIPVTAEQAQTAYQLALQSGPVAGAFCTNSTAALLRGVPGFQDIKSTFYPAKLMDQFAGLPGVTTEKYYEDDSADLALALAATNAALTE